MRILMCLGLIALLAGCGGTSKEELDSTKSTLANVRQERDDLQAQVTRLRQLLDDTKADLAKKTDAAATGEKAAKAPMAAKSADAKTGEKPVFAKAKHPHKS